MAELILKSNEVFKFNFRVNFGWMFFETLWSKTRHLVFSHYRADFPNPKTRIKRSATRNGTKHQETIRSSKEQMIHD